MDITRATQPASRPGVAVNEALQPPSPLPLSLARRAHLVRVIALVDDIANLALTSLWWLCLGGLFAHRVDSFLDLPRTFTLGAFRLVNIGLAHGGRKTGCGIRLAWRRKGQRSKVRC